MIIANPIYDTVFKRLMENEPIVKFFISTLLNEDVVSVNVKPQEYTYTKQDIAELTLAALTIYRVDFVATIRTASGGYKKVLIEIQKAQNKVDLMRFRHYLGDQYKKKDPIGEESVPFPITTIYILGFDLHDIPSPCLKVSRNYEDLINHVAIATKNDFIELLTHDSYIVQVNRVGGRYQTRLDKLLSLFEQRYFVGDNKVLKEYLHQLDDPSIANMTDILHYLATDPSEKEKIDVEVEANRTFDELFGESIQTITEQKQVIAQQEQALAEKEQVITQKDEALAEKEQVVTQKDEALAETEQALAEKDRLIAELLRKIDPNQ